jgi:protease I
MTLSGARIALLIEDMFEDGLVLTPRQLLMEAGAQVVYVAPMVGRTYRGLSGTTVTADMAAGAARADEFDAVIIPGGYAPDRIRLRHAMVDLVRDTMAAGKPLAAIDHGPSVLINANVLRDRTLTCWPSIAVDVKNAGGRYMDRQVHEDGNLITSRKIDDVVPFTETLIRQVAARRATMT